jgi:hypothetical protein
MSEVADLGLVDEIAQRPECLVDVRGRIRAMSLIEVNRVGVQPPPRVLDAADDPAPGRPAPARILARRKADFGREHDVAALAGGQRVPDDLLRARGAGRCRRYRTGHFSDALFAPIPLHYGEAGEAARVTANDS